MERMTSTRESRASHEIDIMAHGAYTMQGRRAGVSTKLHFPPLSITPSTLGHSNFNETYLLQEETNLLSPLHPIQNSYGDGNVREGV